MTNKLVIETDKLILRNWQQEDASRLYEIAKDPDIGPRCGWTSHQNIDESKMIITHVFDDLTFAIYAKELQTIIGCISLMLQDKANMPIKEDEAELGYWIDKEQWGHNYACMAASMLIDHAFNVLGLSKIWCGNFSENKQSARVKEKLGFKYSHTIKGKYIPLIRQYKDDEIGFLTKEMWEQND